MRAACRGEAADKLRWVYAFASLILIAVYPVLPDKARLLDFRLVSFGALLAVAFGVKAVKVGNRLTVWLLLSGMMIVNVGLIVKLAPGGIAATVSGALDTVGNVVLLGAALSLIVRAGRGDVGGIIDTVIIAVAVGGLLWDLLLFPHEEAVHQGIAAETELFVVVFALAGVLGALIRQVQTAGEPMSGLWLLLAALGLAIAGNVIQALTNQSAPRTVALMLFMGAYTSIGLFGLDPDIDRVLRRRPITRDNLSGLRVFFLGAAVAFAPLVVGISEFTGGHVNGVLVAVGGLLVTVLVMIRIRRLSMERDRAEQALRHNAAHDPLTSLLNRREFVTRLRAELSRDAHGVILFCDLDGFKMVNDRHGHAAGDELLVEVAQRLQACVRKTDLVARFGGDEFVILLSGAQLDDVDAVLDCLAAGLSRPISVPGETVAIGASIGLVAATADRSPEELIRQADLAMYNAKRTRPEVPTVRTFAA